MLKRLSLILSLAITAAALPGLAVAEEEDAPAASRNADRDAVLCLKNVTDEAVLAIVYEGFMDRVPSMRKLKISPDKTACMRYADPYRIVADFYLENETSQRLKAFDGICNRVKFSQAQFYLLGKNPANGRKTCMADKSKTEEQIRAYVADAKPIGL